MQQTVKIELTENEFNMLIDKLKWMDCIVRGFNFDYTKYCNGECGHECNRPDLCGFEKWIKSKVVEE